MADKRTSEMVQRRAEYVPEELRPNGLREKIGWYAGNIPETFKTGMGPWPIAEREYDTKPFGPDIGADKTMEFILRELLLGNSALEKTREVDEAEKERLRKEAELEEKARKGESSRWAGVGEFLNQLR